LRNKTTFFPPPNVPIPVIGWWKSIFIY
jgi:hypothetical protein